MLLYLLSILILVYRILPFSLECNKKNGLVLELHCKADKSSKKTVQSSGSSLL